MMYFNFKALLISLTLAGVLVSASSNASLGPYDAEEEEEELATIGNMVAQKLEEQQSFQTRFLAGDERELFELEESFLTMVNPRRAQAADECVEEEAEIEFFDIAITLRPEDDEECSLADQYLLGNDINLLLLEYGVGDAGADDSIQYIAGVCSAPDSRRMLRSRTRPAYVYTGGGACRSCGDDDRDHRGRLRQLVTSHWFENVFKPTMEASMEAAILTELAPNHSGCLGANPTVAVDVEGVSFDEVGVYCGTGTGVEISVLNTIGHTDWILRDGSCGTCSKIDFSKGGDDTWLPTNAYKKSHGVNIRVKGGYSRNSGEARIFDTANPVTRGVGDADLGSPNEDCSGGGPGEGDGGARGEEGENCVPLGNILVIQSKRQTEIPDDNHHGGSITISFDDPVLFNDIGFVDSDDVIHKIKLTYSGGNTGLFKYRGLGDNSVQRVIVNRDYVTKVEVIFERSGAITEFNYCPVC